MSTRPATVPSSHRLSNIAAIDTDAGHDTADLNGKVTAFAAGVDDAGARSGSALVRALDAFSAALFRTTTGDGDSNAGTGTSTAGRIIDSSGNASTAANSPLQRRWRVV